jgi:hypothetical protein
VRQHFAALPGALVEESVRHQQFGLVGVTTRLRVIAKSPPPKKRTELARLCDAMAFGREPEAARK